MKLAPNIIKTVCGKTFKLSFLDQVALGIYNTEEFSDNSTEIPATFSLYRAFNKYFILEVTEYKNDDLITTHQLLPESEATRFLDRGISFR